MTTEEAFEYLGITKFHKAGYTGKNVRIMSGEKIIKDYYSTDRWHKVICPAGYQTNESKWHGSSVMSILLDVCPDATFYAYPFDLSPKGSKCAEYIKENNIHLFTTSNTGGTVNSTKAKLMQECIDNGCTFFAPAGNKGEDGILPESKSDKYLTIGIADFVDNKLQWVNPSSVGEELDYVSLAGAYDRWTSWMTPQFTGMCGLVQDFFIVNTGRALNREELIRFIDDNLMDLEEKGHDIKTGKGLFRLPDPVTIDISKYVSEYKEEDRMPIICIDAGHGIDTAGKRSPDGSLLEYEFNRDVANRIEDILAKHNVEVLTCYGEDDTPLTQRCQMANMFKADYFVSIHANAHKSYWNEVSGWEIYVVSKGGKAEELANKIHKHSIEDLGLKDRGVKMANFTVLTDTDMPAVLIEHGFYTNKEECEKLKSDSFRQKCAECDAKGILEQLGIKYEEGKDTNVSTKNEVTDTNVGELVLKIGQKTYTINGQKKELEVAPMIINGRTLTTVAPLRDLGLEVIWNEKDETVTIRKEN